MEIRKDAKEAWTSEFWYDLTDGGGIEPEAMLDPIDAKKVNDAIRVIREYEQALEDAGYTED